MVHRRGPALAWFGLGNHLHKLFRRGRELKTKAGGIASCHHGRARGRASGIGRIAVTEIHAFAGNTVDVGRRHLTTGNAATIERDVVKAQVVCHDQNDIGGPLIRACRGLRGTGFPVDFLRWSVVLAHHVFHVQKQRAARPAYGIKTGSGQ